jgi:hypothetical protein
VHIILDICKHTTTFDLLLTNIIKMPPKEEFKPKPNSKSEKNKPKGGKAKDEKRAADKAKKEAKAGTGPVSFGTKK